MLSSGRRSLRLKKSSERQLWICKRCFHAQNLLHAAQQPQSQNASTKSTADKSLSPTEAFRQRFAQRGDTTEPLKQTTSPADLFRTNWTNLHPSERPAPPLSNTFTLGDLAEAYRKSGISKNYKRDIGAINPRRHEDTITLEEVNEATELQQLSEMDDMEEGSPEVFGGENVREYQGVLPLNGEKYVHEKFHIKQGALIEIRGDSSNIGIVVTDRYLESHQLCYALNVRGRLFICRPSATVFVLPGFAPLDEVRKIDELLCTANEPIPKRPDRIPQVPVGNLQEYTEMINSLSLRLHHLKMETDKLLKEIRHDHKSVYPLLRHEDPTRTTSVFTPDVAKLLFNTEEPTHAELYAVHKLLADDQVHFSPDPTRHLETATFLVRANRDVLLVSRVANWIRESSAEIESFLDKSRRLIAISRSLPKTTVPTKLDIHVPPELYFIGNDRLIIEFISGYITGRRGFIPGDLLALTPLIIKRTGMYPQEITPNPDRNAAKLFLTEIGVWQPSESIPSHTDAGVIVNRMYGEQTATESFDDANADIRHDFGDMPVYTIDDESAHELDDGISVEETDQGIWLHIHIANPSAFFSPQSHIAQLARLRQTSMYLPGKMHPMLPVGDEKFLARGFSKDSQVMPTMTFSARLSSDGNIADYKVRPGVVRNVKVLTYDDVNKTVFPGEAPKRKAWWTPSYSTPNYTAMGKSFDSISTEIQSHLRLIENTIQSHRTWRTNQGALGLNFNSTSIHVNPKPLEWEICPSPQTRKSDLAALRKTVPAFIRGNAGIMLSLGDQSSRSRSLIEEMMIIAGRIAGLFAQQHNLPVAYRGLSTSIPSSLLEECRSMHISGIKQLPLSLSRQVIASASAWILQQSSTPQNHDLLGISAKNGGYVQVTSPMRRYLDILAHWQFEAHLRGSSLPFSLSQLAGTGELSLLQASRRLFRRVYISRKYNQFFAAHAVSQLISDPEEIGSTHLEFVHGKPRLTGVRVDREIQGMTNLVPRMIAVRELGVNGILMLRSDEKLPDVESEFPVEIREVNDVDGLVIFMLKSRA